VHTSERSIIYLATPNATSPFQWVGEVDEIGHVVEWKDVSISYERPRMSYMGLRLCRRVVINGLDATGLPTTVECHNMRTCENGPFYQRYMSQWTLNGLSVGIGTSEFMDVRRMKSRWIRPFLRLPWKSVHMGTQ
ncbi:MAG: hypothetical protein NTX15_05375, partial [Candidatus Kapabacteria bacterium]|nr:hypothetical protein [Candidatus Kapabacteria bacterium]